MECLNFLVGLRTLDGWIRDKYQVKTPTNDGKLIFQLCNFVLSNLWKDEGIFQLQITALNPQPLGLQLDLFETHDEIRSQVNTVMDKVQ
jgi:DNA polymerase IV